MKQFESQLKKINNKLDLPQPVKSRIVLEIAADMEDTFNFYFDKGMNEKDALQKTSIKRY